MTSTITELFMAADGVVFFKIEDSSPDSPSQFTRGSIMPGGDLTGRPQEIIDFCGENWTPEIIASYQASLPVRT